ncbi:FAS1 domain-containing protein [Thelephora terrestris]|uniref:FAS1 domain-containing protein n=1 Tax=Thelephora terrestris TaxID=56493 RepID=A0A9P6H639_9AGAM|nr:FAS1 domain-containing protein [Thelephora terrestris]
MVFVLSTLLLALTATLANAQSQNSTYVSGLIQALNNAGLTTLATAVGAVNSTNVGSQLLSQLSDQSRNFTVFAPNNDAFNNVSSSITQDPNALTDIVAYHVVFGHFNNVTVYPNTTIGRTALGDPAVVMLEGNKDQVVAWAKRDDGQVHVLNQNQTNDPIVVQLASYQNLQLFIIDGVLLYPGNFSTTLQSNSQLSGFANFAQNTQVPVWDTSANTTENVTVIQDLSGVRGLTLFAPDDQAFNQQIPSSISGNTTALWAVMRNHVINGTTVYSPSFDGSTYVSAAGEDFHFTSNSSGQYVTSGNTTARIIQPDVLIKNGVIHIIDQVLLNTDVDQSAANSAYSSATSAAGHSSTETGPVGVPTGGSSTNKANGAVGNVDGVSSFGVVALSAILGSFLFV